MILDIGCGSLKKGKFPLLKENVVHADLSKDASHLEVVCDISYLPFKNECFDVVYASHIMEHLLVPSRACEELWRVSKVYVIVRVPNASRTSISGEDSEHLFSWNKFTLKQFLEKFFPVVTIYLNERLPRIPHSKLRTFANILAKGLIQPKELYAICQKERRGV